MLYDQFATQIQAKADPINALKRSIGCPHKLAKEAGLICLRDADALIPNADEHGSLLLLLAQDHLDLSALWAVLDGIGEQVRQHLLDAFPVHLCQ